MPFRLLRDALWQLSLEPHEQRRELHGSVVTDELALDLANALDSLEHAEEEASIVLPNALVSELRRLSAVLDTPPGDSLWRNEALDNDPRWAEARRLSGDMLSRLPAVAADLPGGDPPPS